MSEWLAEVGVGTYQRCRNNTLWPRDFIPQAMCISTGSGFAWGFSKELSTGILLTHVIWIFTTWLVWLYVQENSLRVRQKRTFRGPIRTAVQLVESMQRNLGGDLRGYSERELRGMLAGQSGMTLNDDWSVEMSELRKRTRLQDGEDTG